MKETLANKIKALRKDANLSQEQLANICQVSVQAVSKWECCLSYPDIELLPVIARAFNVSIDSLLLDDVQDSNTLPWNNDDTIRVVQYHGHKLLSVNEITEKITLKLPTMENGMKTIFNVEITGDTRIEGSVGGSVTVQAGDFSCHSVGCDVNVTSGDASCQGVGHDVRVTSGDVSCLGVGGGISIQSGNLINCQKIHGAINITDGDINCESDLKVDGAIRCENINVKGSLNCPNISCNTMNKK